MQLELLVPRQWRHPTKEFLKAWYSRIGYRPVRTGKFEESYPELAPQLATPCDFVIYHKPLPAFEHDWYPTKSDEEWGISLMRQPAVWEGDRPTGDDALRTFERLPDHVMESAYPRPASHSALRR